MAAWKTEYMGASVNGMRVKGEDIAKVYQPDNQDSPLWFIEMKNGHSLWATGNVTVEVKQTKIEKEEEKWEGQN